MSPHITTIPTDVKREIDASVPHVDCTPAQARTATFLHHSLDPSGGATMRPRGRGYCASVPESQEKTSRGLSLTECPLPDWVASSPRSPVIVVCGNRRRGIEADLSTALRRARAGRYPLGCSFVRLADGVELARTKRPGEWVSASEYSPAWRCSAEGCRQWDSSG